MWKDPDVAFGVEFKLPPPDAGLKTYTGWVAQAVSYTHIDWDRYGRRVVLTCPGVTEWLDIGPSESGSRRDILVAKRLTGQLGIGELVLRWGYGLTVLLKRRARLVGATGRRLQEELGNPTQVRVPVGTFQQCRPSPP